MMLVSWHTREGCLDRLLLWSLRGYPNTKPCSMSAVSRIMPLIMIMMEANERCEDVPLRIGHRQGSA